jgi:hypothetical protein
MPIMKYVLAGITVVVAVALAAAQGAPDGQGATSQRPLPSIRASEECHSVCTYQDIGGRQFVAKTSGSCSASCSVAEEQCEREVDGDCTQQGCMMEGCIETSI